MNVLKFIFLITLLLIVNTSFSDQLTNSKKLELFNTPTKERDSWVSSQNKIINDRLAKSKNAQKLAKLYRIDFDKDSLMQTEQSSDGKKYQLIDRGLGKPQEIVSEKGATKEVVFSNFWLAKNNTYNTLGFKLNKSANKVAVAFDFKGSTDVYTLVVYDLISKKLLLKNPKISFIGQTNAYFFKDDNTIVTQTNDGLMAYDLSETNAPQLLYKDKFIKSIVADWVSIDTQEDTTLLISNNNSFETKGLTDAEFIGEKDNSLYFLKLSRGKDPAEAQVVRVNESDLQKKEVIVDVKESLKNIKILSHHLVGFVTNGSNRSVVFFDLQDINNSKRIEMPDCCSVVSVDESPDDKNKINLTLNSEIVRTKIIQWDLIKNEIVDLATIKTEMQMSQSLEIVTEFRNIKSFDGTLVPIKMVYKKGLNLKNVPVYMETYGGFGLAGYLDPAFNAFNLKFIEQNGLYVGTGVRGGNEYGNSWHEAAQLGNKYKTYEDVASIAKYFIDNEMSTKEKIIIAGSSNGGLTVAATALLYPQYFGLSIPHNGVLDLLAKEELDPNFDFGWSYEYGDSRKEEDNK